MATILTSSELIRIDEIARKSIMDCFKRNNFKFTRSDVEEVVLMTNEKVARNWAKYDKSKSTSAWFARMAYHCTYEYMSRETKWACLHQGIKMISNDGEVYEAEYSDRESPERYEADHQIIINETMEAVDQEIDALGQMAAHALRLQAQGYSYAEIENILGSNANALRAMVSRGRSQVKRNLEYRYVA